MKNRAEVEEYLRRAGFLILEAARENIFVSDAEGRIVYFNPAAEETTGYRLPDLIGQNIDVFYEDKGVSARAQEEITMTGRPKAYEAVCLDKAGGRHILSVKKAPLFNETGRLVGFMAVSRDVTRERLHEEELRAIKEFNEAVLNAAEDMITVTDREGMVTYFNPAAERITGYTREQVLGRNVTMFYRDAPAALRKMDEIADQNAPQAYETVIVDRFGQEHIFSIKKAPLYDDDHHLIGFTATSRDITQSRKREGEIQALKEFNEAILNSVHDLVVVTDTEGRITYFNPMAEERLGYSLAELKNRHIREIYKEPGFSDQKLDYIRSTGEANSYEAVILTKDGQERILEVNKAPLHDAAGRLIGFAAVSRDITRRRRAEERVNELQELMTSGHPAVVESELIGTRVRDLMNAKPVSILPDMTVAQAAERMLQHDLAGLPVVGAAGDVLGLVTMKELVRRGLFHGVDWTTPVHRVMQSDYAAVQPDTFYFDALTAMVKGGAPVVLATEGRHLRGVLTMNDLMRSRGASVIGVLEGIDAQTTIEGLAGFRPEVDRILASLVVDGALASQITGIITEFNDRITRRVVALCEARLGPSPAHYAWLGLGSEGRKEQTLTTDQDNALVFEDWVQGDENALVYFSRLAQEVVRALERCGFKVCLGQIMASQPKWSGGLELWLERVRTWVGVPTARGTRDAMTFLDFRTVYGDAGLARSLRDQANQIFRENPRVLTPMAEDTLSKAPPLGLFKRFILEKSGDYKGMLNLKAQGTLVLVDALRLLAVKEGLFETNTLDRLAGLSQRNLFTTSQADSIREAYQTLMGLRLRANIRAIQEHRDPNNHVDPDQLPHWHQQRLRDAFLIAEDLQKAVRQNFWWLGR